MKVNNNTELKQDNYAAIGIGAMIVFISLILVAAVASAVIIQTAEKLQQNAQKTGDDTASELRAKINVLGGYLDDQGNDNYVLLVKLAAGSEDVPTTDIIVQMQCGTTANNQLGGVGVAVEEMDTIDDGITDAGTMTADTGYAMQIAGAAACNAESSIPVFIHIKGAGSTYEVLQIDDRTDGAPII
tara:strand:- start:1282 stop:1839 length:558 start_codon:yes stop_codon:yes gene_type:complete